MFNLILVAPDIRLCRAFEKKFVGLPSFEVVHGRFEQVATFDCMVSAANSFGLMDGGIDLAITNYFGHQLERRVQRMIVEQYLGEQPVGTSMIVPTEHVDHPWLAHTPTMRVPNNITFLDNVYNAMWGLLVAVHHHNLTNASPIKSVLCPGLGTGYGQMPFVEAARQMAAAWDHYHRRPQTITWEHATDVQKAVRFGGNPKATFPMATD